MKYLKIICCTAMTCRLCRVSEHSSIARCNAPCGGCRPTRIHRDHERLALPSFQASTRQGARRRQDDTGRSRRVGLRSVSASTAYGSAQGATPKLIVPAVWRRRMTLVVALNGVSPRIVPEKALPEKLGRPSRLWQCAGSTAEVDCASNRYNTGSAIHSLYIGTACLNRVMRTCSLSNSNDAGTCTKGCSINCSRE